MRSLRDLRSPTSIHVSPAPSQSRRPLPNAAASVRVTRDHRLRKHSCCVAAESIVPLRTERYTSMCNRPTKGERSGSEAGVLSARRDLRAWSGMAMSKAFTTRTETLKATSMTTETTSQLTPRLRQKALQLHAGSTFMVTTSMCLLETRPAMAGGTQVTRAASATQTWE